MNKSRRQGFGDIVNKQISRPKEIADNSADMTKEQQALRLINQGKPNEAEIIYREIINAGSENHIVYGNLGSILQMKGDIQNSIAYFKKALQLKNNYPIAHYNLGNAFAACGDLTSAITSLKTALKLKPNYPAAHNNLGNALQEKGDLTAAITSFKTALKLKPNYPDAHYNLGNALKEQGNLNAAINSFKTALQINPNYPEAYNNLGNALREKGNLTAAISCFKTALKLKPNYSDAYNNLGIAFRECGDLDEALANHKKAIDLEPENSQAFYGLGRVQEVKGNLKDSKLSFHKAVELNPTNTSALFQLSKDIESDEESRDLAKKLEKTTRDGLSRQAESMLEFTFANFHHKSKNYAKATEHLLKANTLKLSFYPSDLSKHLLDTKKIIELTSLLKEGKPSAGQGRIFIVGAPRCGSTLLESAISTDSSICDLGESKALGHAFAQTISNIRTAEDTFSLSDAYSTITNDITANYTHSVDKNLYNFRFAEAIALEMPSARIIHCRRHPLDNILSMLRSSLEYGNNYTSDPTEAAKFLIHQEEIMNEVKSKYDKHIFTFEYDKFVSNPEKILRPLIHWLDLEWNERYLHPEANERLIKTASVIQARQPINNKSVGGWKNYREILKSAEMILKESGLFKL